MKKLAFNLTLILFINFAYSQESTWTASFDMGLQEHDKRLFDFPQKNFFLSIQPEFLGTYQAGFSLAKNWEKTKGLTKKIGIGLHVETATFRRPFDHSFRQEIGFDIVRICDNYRNVLIPIELGIGYSFNVISLQLSVISQINVLSVVTNYDNKFTWLRLNLYSTELYPNVIFRISDQMKIRLGYRAFKLKNIDPVIFFSVVNNGDNKGYETYNPFKLLLSFQYDLKSKDLD